MVPAVQAAAIQGGAGILGSVVSGLFNAGAQHNAYKQNKRLMELQNQFNIDMWNRNNEYNTPKMQMQRYMDAGLNPNLVYGNGTNGNSSSPAESSDYTPSQPVHYDTSQAVMGIQNAVNTYMQYQQMEANIKKQNAETNLINTQANYWDYRVSGENMRNEVFRRTIEEQVGSAKRQYELLGITISEKKENINLLKSKLKLTDKQAELASAQIADIASSILTRQYQRELMKSQTSLNYKNHRLIDSIVERNSHLNHLTDWQAKVNEVDFEFRAKSMSYRLNRLYWDVENCVTGFQNGQLQLDEQKLKNQFRYIYGVDKPSDLGTFGETVVGGAIGVGTSLGSNFGEGY